MVLCAGMGDDDKTGSTIYGYVMDSCGDSNIWCQNDYYHLDISEKYLESKGLRQGSTFNARMMHWKYINWVPNECARFGALSYCLRAVMCNLVVFALC